MKKFTSLVLALVMVISVASFSASANSGAKVMPEINSVYAANPDEVERTEELGGWCTYYFYMPEKWKNSYNDYYDGTEDSYCAGVYWWEGPFNAEDFANSWPGYAVLESEVDNVYCAQVPSSVTTILWNNGVDPGNSPNAPELYQARQTDDIVSSSYGPMDDVYDFYPDGIESFDGMIYVIDPDGNKNSTQLEITEIGFGQWFYYYGNGQYGQYPTIKEATANNAVYSDGEFPALGGRPDKPPVIEHSHTPKVINKKSATYFANGYTGDTVCSDCNETISKGKTVAKLKLKVPTVKLTGAKKKLTINYTKVTGATGFEVKYKLGKKTVTKVFNTKKNVKKTIKKLAKGNYKVQVRVFVKQGSNTAYSAWTTAKKVKVK